MGKDARAYQLLDLLLMLRDLGLHPPRAELQLWVGRVLRNNAIT